MVKCSFVNFTVFLVRYKATLLEETFVQCLKDILKIFSLGDAVSIIL